MSNHEIKAADLRLAKLEYYNGKDIDLNLASTYVVLIHNSGQFINPFSFGDNYPVCEINVNSSENSETKLHFIYSKCDVGPVLLLTDFNFSEFFSREKVFLHDIENFILKYDAFFKDRSLIAKERLGQMKWQAEMLGIIRNDEELNAEMQQFFLERGINLQKIKQKK